MTFLAILGWILCGILATFIFGFGFWFIGDELEKHFFFGIGFCCCALGPFALGVSALITLLMIIYDITPELKIPPRKRKSRKRY